MNRLRLPNSFRRYRKIGGVLEFCLFGDAAADEDDALAAIAAALPDADIARLRTLGCRILDDATFYGDWYDAASDQLISLGHHTFADGETLIDPTFEQLARMLERKRLKAAARGGDAPGSGGQFAGAFCNPPYPLQASLKITQDLFRNIRDIVLPREQPHTIRDWASPSLPLVSPYFKAGMEWWGVFLFTIHIPSQRQLNVIVGSTTD